MPPVSKSPSGSPLYSSSAQAENGHVISVGTVVVLRVGLQPDVGLGLQFHRGCRLGRGTKRTRKSAEECGEQNASAHGALCTL